MILIRNSTIIYYDLQLYNMKRIQIHNAKELLCNNSNIKYKQLKINSFQKLLKTTKTKPTLLLKYSHLSQYAKVPGVMITINKAVQSTVSRQFLCENHE